MSQEIELPTHQVQAMAEGDIQHNIQDKKDEVEEHSSANPETNVGITRRQVFVLISLIYNHFWGAACYSIQAPFFPNEAEKKGASPTEYGMVFSAYELVVILASPIFGKLIPVVSPKFLMVSGSFLMGGACTLFGILDKIHSGRVYIAMAFLCRIVEGLGAASYVTASFAIIASEFPNSVGKAFSLTETGFGFGLIAGPAVGGVLFQAGGFLLPFVVNGGLMFIGALLFFLLMPTIEDVGARRSGAFKNYVLDPGIVTHLFAIVTTFLLIGFNAGTLEPHLREFNIRPAVLGVIFVTTGAVYAVTTPLWGWIADKGVSSYTMMAIGYFITIIGMLLIGPVPFIPFNAKPWTVIVSLVIIGVGMAMKLVAGFTGAVKLTPVLGFPDNLATYGMVSAVFSFVCSLGAFIGPFLGGLLLETVGYQYGTIVLFSFEVLFFSLLMAFVLWKKRSSSEDQESTPILNSENRQGSSTEPPV